MVVKVYVSNISAIQQVKTQQRHVVFVLSSKSVAHVEVDISDPANQGEKEFMLQNGAKNEKGQILSPQIFNDSELCGDYAAFYEALESETMYDFLKIETPEHEKAALKIHEAAKESHDEKVDSERETVEGNNDDDED